MLCGDLSYLEGPRRASGRCPFPAVSGLGARPDRIGSQGAKEAQEGGSDALGHLGWFIGEVHVGSQESVGSRVLVGWRLGCARWGAVVQRSPWCWHIPYRHVTREICRPSSQNATGMWWNSGSTFGWRYSIGVVIWRIIRRWIRAGFPDVSSSVVSPGCPHRCWIGAGCDWQCVSGIGSGPGEFPSQRATGRLGRWTSPRPAGSSPRSAGGATCPRTTPGPNGTGPSWSQKSSPSAWWIRSARSCRSTSGPKRRTSRCCARQEGHRWHDRPQPAPQAVSQSAR